MSGRFTFTLTEREASVLLDALDAATVTPPPDAGWGRDAYADLAGMLAERIAW